MMGSICSDVVLVSKVRSFPGSQASSPRDQVDPSLPIMTIDIAIERRTLHLTPKRAMKVPLPSCSTTLHLSGAAQILPNRYQ